MDIHVATTAANAVAADAVVVGIFKGSRTDGFEGPAAALDAALGGAFAAMRRDGELAGGAQETTVVHTLGKLETPRVVLVGLGPRKDLSFEILRRAAAAGCRAARRAGARHVALALWRPELAHLGIGATHAGEAMAEGALYGLYEFKKYKSNHESNGDNGKRVEQITLLGEDEAALRHGSERGRVIGEAVNFCRDLGNEPPNVLTPTELANRSRAMAETYGLECEILEREQMQELGMGCLLGVAQGSAQPPKFIILRYQGDPGGAPGLALVGKGITFDTGGISIKPAANMEEMKMDMCGAAAVIAAMQAIAGLKPKINVTALAPATENMPGGNAYRPGDILRAMNGKTVEIVNTDAEGRLVLADAITYAIRHGATHIVDLATLTGAAATAIGHAATAGVANDDALWARVWEAADRAGDRVWRLPIYADYSVLLQSRYADLRNADYGQAGTITGGMFIEQFAEGKPWVHLDIAASSWNDKGELTTIPRTPTGAGTRICVHLAELMAAEAR